jgi:hypothetical protein
MQTTSSIRRYVDLAAVALALLATSCGNTRDAASGAKVCEPHATRECFGPGACTGEQSCKGDGTTWGACDCSSAPPTIPDAGGPQQTLASVDVGPAGGVVEVKGSSTALEGMRIQVPAGALRTAVTLTISTSQDARQPLPDNSIAASPVVVLGPDGLTFDKPVFATLPHQHLDGIDDSDLQVVLSDGLTWHAATVVQRDLAMQQITVAVLHFSALVALAAGPTPQVSAFDPSVDGFGFADAKPRCAGMTCFAKCFYDTQKSKMMMGPLSQYASEARRQEIADDAQKLLEAQESSLLEMLAIEGSCRVPAAKIPSAFDALAVEACQNDVVTRVQALVKLPMLVSIVEMVGTVSQDLPPTFVASARAHALLVYSCSPSSCSAYDPALGKGVEVAIDSATGRFTDSAAAASGLKAYYFTFGGCDCRAMNVADVAGTWRIKTTVAGKTDVQTCDVVPERVGQLGYSLSFNLTKDPSCPPSPFITSTPVSGLDWPMKPDFTSDHDYWVVVNGTARDCIPCNGEIKAESLNGLGFEGGTYSSASCIPNTTQTVTGSVNGTRVVP